MIKTLLDQGVDVQSYIKTKIREKLYKTTRMFVENDQSTL
jgi:hypothetical protein